jgi:hypothetical protein
MALLAALSKISPTVGLGLVSVVVFVVLMVVRECRVEVIMSFGGPQIMNKVIIFLYRPSFIHASGFCVSVETARITEKMTRMTTVCYQVKYHTYSMKAFEGVVRVQNKIFPVLTRSYL